MKRIYACLCIVAVLLSIAFYSSTATMHRHA